MFTAQNAYKIPLTLVFMQGLEIKFMHIELQYHLLGLSNSGHSNKNGDVASEVLERMKLDGGFLSAEFGPWKN